MRLLRSLTRCARCGAVIVSYDERLRAIADRVVWLEDGLITRIEEPDRSARVSNLGPVFRGTRAVESSPVGDPGVDRSLKTDATRSRLWPLLCDRVRQSINADLGLGGEERIQRLDDRVPPVIAPPPFVVLARGPGADDKDVVGVVERDLYSTSSRYASSAAAASSSASSPASNSSRRSGNAVRLRYAWIIGCTVARVAVAGIGGDTEMRFGLAACRR